MNRIWKTASAAGLTAAATVLCALPASAAPRPPARPAPNAGGVVFAQTDDVNGNAVVAFDRTAAGGLTQAGTYPTGGRGGALTGAVFDHLASQGSLAYDRSSRLLYAVNAGSDTLTTFAVTGDRLTRRQVLGTGGTFPVSVAARGGLVFVLNGRDGGSVSGYRQVRGTLVPVPSWHRELGLSTSAPGQSDEFVRTPGQIGFTPDGSKLVVTTKGGGNSIAVFGLGPAGPAPTPVVTSLPGAVPFGFDFDGRGHLVVSEAGPNAVATFAIGPTGALTQIDSAPTGEQATCWVVAANGTLYASNTGSATVSVFRTTARGTLTGQGTVAADAGPVDAAVSPDGRYLYVQTGGAGLIDAYRVSPDGSLTPAGSTAVANAAGGEGIVAL